MLDYYLLCIYRFKEAPPIEENPTKDNSPNDDVKPTSIVENNNQENASILMNSNVDVKNEEVVCPMCHGTLPTQKDFQAHAELCNIHFKGVIFFRHFHDVCFVCGVFTF